MFVSFNKIKHLSTALLACTLFFNFSANARVFPLNNLSREDRPNQVANITAEQFRALALRFQTAFSPIVARYGATLQMRLNWTNPDVNAFAFREGNVRGKPIWQVQIFGGLVRRPELTYDAITLIMCHELGHHLGGYPFKSGYEDNSGQWVPEPDWAATEGEADYFASQVCVKKLWGSEKALNAQLAVGVSEEVRFACKWNNPRNVDDQNLCFRILNASLSLNVMFARLDGYLDPHMRARNKEAVEKTYESHPVAQCRFDTYVAGALCGTPNNLQTIPGLFPGEITGTNNVKAEANAMSYSCRQERRYDPRYAARYGARPLCWFKPLTPPR